MYEELIKQLNRFSAEHQRHGGITAEAADAIEKLQAEVSRLSEVVLYADGQIADAERERDAAVADMKAMHDNNRHLDCRYCKHLMEDYIHCKWKQMNADRVCRGKYWEWRGVQEVNNG